MRQNFKVKMTYNTVKQSQNFLAKKQQQFHLPSALTSICQVHWLPWADVQVELIMFNFLFYLLFLKNDLFEGKT